MNLTQAVILLVIMLVLNMAWNHYFTSNSNLPDDSSDTTPHVNAEKAESKKTEFQIKIFFTFLAILPLLAGLWAMNYWFRDYNTAVDTVNWDSYPGKMLSKSVSHYRSPTQIGHQSSGLTYVPDVLYEFTYKDKVFKWDVIDYLNKPAHGDTDKIQKVLDTLPEVGAPVTVYFSPKHKKAVLITGAKNSNYFGIIAGGFFFFIGFAWLKLIHGF